MTLNVLYIIIQMREILQLKKILLILLISFFIVSVYSKPRVWSRIQEFYVDDCVIRFLNNNKITNCFGFYESPNILLLKCWRENKLTDVKIVISNSASKNYIPNSYIM